MAVESTAGGTMITGTNIQMFAMRACLSALSIDINTGMKRRGRSAMSAANGWLTMHGKPRMGTKRGTYMALRALLTEQGMEPNDQRSAPWAHKPLD